MMMMMMMVITGYWPMKRLAYPGCEMRGQNRWFIQLIYWYLERLVVKI